MNRPIIRQLHNGGNVIMFGLETVIASSKVFHDRLSADKLVLPRAEPNGPINRSMGAMQTKLGDSFRGDVTLTCRKKGFLVVN